MKKLLLLILLGTSLQSVAQIATGVNNLQAFPWRTFSNQNMVGLIFDGSQYRMYGFDKYALLDTTNSTGKFATKYDISLRALKATTLSGYGITDGVTSTDLTNGLATKENLIASGTSNQYWRGDKTWQTLNTTSVPEGSNLYYTQTRFDNAFAAKTTTNLTEGTNQYFTNARARSTLSASNGVSYNSSTGNITLTKRQQAYTGTTDGSGLYTITYSSAFSSQPIVVPSIITSNPRDVAMVTASSATGFTIQVQRRVDVLGLLPSYTNLSGIRIDVFVIEP